MKSEFLKLAGVKSEKAFYKKYPTEAAFFKAHPEAKKMTKKAQAGMELVASYAQQLQNVPNMNNVIQGQMQSPGVNANMYSSTPYPAPDYNQMYKSMSIADEQLKKPQGAVPENDALNKGLGALPGMAGSLFQGFSALKAEKKAKKEAQKWAAVTDVQARAAESEDVDKFREYTENASRRRKAFMPEMIGEEFFPVYGVGTNVLARNGARLEDGGMVGGNPTEIQNTYGTGNSIYDDLGYEPLYNVDEVKAYEYGGGIPKAQNGGMSNWLSTLGGGGSGFSGAGSGGATPWGAIGQVGSGVAGGLTGNNAGGQIGGTIGEAAGAMFGPAGMAIGKTVGSLAGGLLDTNPRDQRKAEAKTKANYDRIIGRQFANDIHQQYGAYAKDGGWVSNDWQPQVIAKFGDLDAQDFAEFAHKDQFRAGGHLKSYTPPSERAMQTYAMGGELKTHWGGYAEPMSENPYLPGDGETVMFRGKSHEEYSPNGETGIGITFGDSPVEVERGEPAVKLKDGSSGEDSLVVYGNLMIPKYGVDLLEDPKAKGKKFKNYVANLSKTEEKQNKLIEKSTEELDDLKVRTSFDKLKLSALEANIKGGNMKLKSIADKKIKAADLQSAINDTAEEYGLVADDLARGKVKVDKEAMKAQAKYGAAIDKFQGGGYKTKGRGDKWSFTKAGETGNPLFDDVQRYENEWTPSVNEALKNQERSKKILNYINSYEGEGSVNVKKALNKIPTEEGKLMFLQQQATNKEVGPLHHIMDAAIKFTAPKMETLEKRKNTPVKNEDATFETAPYKRSKLLDLFGQVLPYIRPTDQEELDPTQLMGEMYALSSNRVEPVQAQPYTPQLRVPYDISLQDQLNEITADQRSAQRMMGYNPAAQANLAAQAYNAKSKVLGEQFRLNQAMEDQVYSGNIATLNDAELKNLAIYDQQYQRQEQAKSNTKATAQAALNSIADKFAKNRLENRTLGVYENLYNYRYDAAGRAINMNAPFQPNIPYIYGSDGKATHKIVYDKTGKNIIGYEPISKEEASKIPTLATPPTNPEGTAAKDEYSPISEDAIMYQERNGGKTKKKNYSQSSIVKAFK